MKINRAQVSARYNSITQWLDAEGHIEVVEAAGRLGVAQETVRRDLRTLEQEGKLQRVHGGAIPIEAPALAAVATLSPPPGDDLALSESLWSALPRSGTILLGAGRLTLTLAQTIISSPPEQVGLTIVTNSLDAAIVLSRATKVAVYNVGGTVSPLTRAQEGDWALTELARFSVDVSVLCPAGVSVERGLTDDTPAAAAVSQAAVSAARRVIVLADAQTLGAAAFVQFATLDQVDEVIVVGEPSGEALQRFHDRGASISVVGGATVAADSDSSREESSS